MNIAGVQYSVNTLSLEIYLSGCDGICDGCCNKEIWDFDSGKSYKKWLSEIDYKAVILRRNPLLFRWIWILGGEPLLQNREELLDLLNFLQKYATPIVLFTRKKLDEVPSEIKEIVKYIKVGEYKKDLESDDYYSKGIKLATTNQKVLQKGVDF